MTSIEAASDDDGSSILRITAESGVFNAEELSCVEELWTTFRDKGEASGYLFLVYRAAG